MIHSERTDRPPDPAPDLAPETIAERPVETAAGLASGADVGAETEPQPCAMARRAGPPPARLHAGGIENNPLQSPGPGAWRQNGT